MIIHLSKDVSAATAADLAKSNQAIHFNDGKREVLVLGAKIKEVPEGLEAHTNESFVTETDIQLASKSYHSGKREVQIGDVTIGGTTGNTMMIAGPCSVESVEQVEEVAQTLKELDIKTFRAGCFKPRTSPYTFQGLGEEGLKILADLRDKYGFNIITEVKDSSHVDLVIEYADIVQIGAKAMYEWHVLQPVSFKLPKLGVKLYLPETILPSEVKSEVLAYSIKETREDITIEKTPLKARMMRDPGTVPQASR